MGDSLDYLLLPFHCNREEEVLVLVLLTSLHKEAAFIINTYCLVKELEGIFLDGLLHSKAPVA
jgi:hypothetical protein